ncbi:dTDP-6-deoxy-L-hexose 3-O-methyltransferase [gamma proteobacterium HTCC5015]|nr:dTDP-6-deoxy-L-hexose 3-O-methyltransferase [gamma proteobacterium HTCC5015]
MEHQTIFGFDLEKAYDYENGFYLTTSNSRLAKAIAQYELYKSIENVPGAIVECGVYKGASLMRFATFRDIENSALPREIVGFDAFGHFPVPKQADKDDQDFIKDFESKGGDGIPKQELEQLLARKNIKNYQLIEGDLLETAPQFLEKNPNFSVALLHIDVDVYEPTKKTLEYFFPRLAPGALIMLDDYNLVDGATRAVDEFLNEHQPNTPLKKLPFTHTPTYFYKAL